MRPIVANLREASTGGEFIGAVTLMLLAVAKVADPSTQSSIVLFLLTLKFPGLWFSLLFLLGGTHLFCLFFPYRRPWLIWRKVCSIVGGVLYLELTWEVYKAGSHTGVIWLGLPTVLLAVAVARRPRATV
jgi:hypothetical protein